MRIPRQLPADIRGFVNRENELAGLNAVLAGADGAPLAVSVLVIAGTAGAGKTSLALRWAHQVLHHFPDGQLYVNMRGYDPGLPVAAHEALHRFLTALGVEARAVPPDLDAASALYRTLLADRRVLVVLDNVAAVSQVRPLLPGGEHSLVVVTSRSRLSGLAVRDGARRVTLGMLPAPEAVALLRAVTAGHRPADDADKLTELARLCARLPLALRLAAERASSHPHMQLDDLIAELRDESALWDALSTGDDEEGDAVRSVFAWSYRALPDDAARLFRLLGLHPGQEFGLRAAAALAGLVPRRTRQLLDSLVGAHLVEQTAPDRYQLHDLLRAYAVDQAQREEPREEQEAAVLRVLHWYLHTADAARSRLKPAEEGLDLAPPAAGVHPLTFADYDAAADWAERDHTNLLHAVRAADTAGQDGLTWQLAAALWLAQSPAAPGADWPAVGRIGLRAAERAGDRPAQGHLLTNLGMAYTQINRLAESRRCHEAALTLRRELGDRLGEARSLNLVGLVHLRTRRLAAATRCFEQAIAGFRALGAVHWEATALSNLASAHRRAGRLPEAAETARTALTAHRALDNRRGEGNILRLMSELQREQGRPEAAVRTAQDALDIALALRDHRLEGYWLIALGDAQQADDRLADALVSYQRSASLHRRLGDRSREALAWHGAGQVHRRLGRLTEAADFHRQAAAVHHDLGDTWHEALALDGLAAAVHSDAPEAARRHRQDVLGLLADHDDPGAVAFRATVERRAAESA